MDGLFPLSLAPPTRRQARLPGCAECGLLKRCTSPKMKVDGDGRRKVLIVGEAPGADEDAQGRPFVGKTGKRLQATLLKLGVELRKDCWIANSLRCRPPKNATPTDRQIEHCRPLLNRTLEELQPDVIIPLGTAAVKSVIGGIWREDPGGVERWMGFMIPCQTPNAWICPTWHPSFVERELTGERYPNPVPEKLWERHLKAAFNLEGKPWKNPPEWEKRVHVMINPESAAVSIRSMCKGEGRTVALDLETTCIKPDGPHARIHSCALSDGFSTVSYPWHGSAVEATRELWVSGVPLICQNAKFEIRWLTKEFGRGPKRLLWDTMLAAHALDSRPGITGLKFLAFALLGYPSYDDAVKPYLRGEGGCNAPNRVHLAPLKDLLTYGGVDALLTWKIAHKQMKQMGVEL